MLKLLDEDGCCFRLHLAEETQGDVKVLWWDPTESFIGIQRILDSGDLRTEVRRDGNSQKVSSDFCCFFGSSHALVQIAGRFCILNNTAIM